MSLRAGSFQGTFHFRHSFIVTTSFLAALHPPHASWLTLLSRLNWLRLPSSLAMAFSNETGKKAAKVVTPSLLRAHNTALRLHPSGLIALRASVSTLSLLSFFPFFLLEKCF